jgi:FAD/FMN-containing dehydrogenase
VTASSALLRNLAAVVGPDQVVVDRAVVASYETDWTGRFAGRARAVVRPASPREVAGVLAACAAEGVGVQIQGGNTGLVGGSVPLDGEVVLSTRRLTRLDAVDRRARQVTVGAGVPLAELHRHARAAGLAYAVDFAARDSATVGGTLAANAGGLRVVAYGDTRRQVRGVEAVLADGTVVRHLNGLAKDNTGYDLGGLLTGSEGTLGVITAARLRLLPAAAPGVVTMVGCASLEEAQALLPTGPLLAAEVLTARAMEVVRRATGLPRPLAQEWPAYLLLETADVPELAAGADAALDPRLWAYRERLTESISTLGVPHKLDVCLPAARLGAFVDLLQADLAGYDLIVFGHLAESNLHVNVLGPPPGDPAVDEVVLGRTVELGGSVSAEHGIGRAKSAWLPRSRTGGDVAAMRAVKRALDPSGLLNPKVLFG